MNHILCLFLSFFSLETFGKVVSHLVTLLCCVFFGGSLISVDFVCQLKGATGPNKSVGGAGASFCTILSMLHIRDPFFQNEEVLTDNLEMKLCRHLE